MRFFFGIVLVLGLLDGCREDDAVSDPLVRGLKVHEVTSVEPSQTRRFPGVLEPADLTVLAFEIGGKLAEIDLDVGQSVKAGDAIARLDPEVLRLQAETAEAAVAQAGASARNAAETLTRQQALLERGTVTRVTVDDARAAADAAAASLAQAETSRDRALEDLGKTELTAPFDGIVNSVEASSFATVSAGAPIATLYSADGFEVSFSVNFDTVSALVVGTKATVRLADRPDVALDAVVSEIGSRADVASSFPIVLQLRATHPLLKAGMAVEAAVDFPLPAREGYPIPISALIKDGQSGAPGADNAPAQAGIFVFDPQSETVKRRDVTVGGIRENMIVVIDGIAPGDLVASAGVSFLSEGQKVRRLGGGT